MGHMQAPSLPLPFCTSQAGEDLMLMLQCMVLSCRADSNRKGLIAAGRGR